MLSLKFLFVFSINCCLLNDVILATSNASTLGFFLKIAVALSVSKASVSLLIATMLESVDDKSMVPLFAVRLIATKLDDAASR